MPVQQSPASSEDHAEKESCDRLVELLLEQQETEIHLIEIEHQIQDLESSHQSNQG
jgi:hypothetical protein